MSTEIYHVVVLVDGELHIIDARDTVEAARELRDQVWWQWQRCEMTEGKHLFIVLDY